MSETVTGTMSPFGFSVPTSGDDDEDRLVGWNRADSNLDQSGNLSPVGDWNSVTENATTQSRTHGSAHEILTAANRTDRYVYASYIDEPIMRASSLSTAKLYYHRNGQYSITALTDATGTIAERYAYDAYGKLTVLDGGGTVLSNSAYGNRYTYTGREWTEELALYHYRARMYDPVAGRFCSRDPIGYRGGSWNVFQYSNSRTLSLADPFGLEPLPPENCSWSCGTPGCCYTPPPSYPKPRPKLPN